MSRKIIIIVLRRDENYFIDSVVRPKLVWYRPAYCKFINMKHPAEGGVSYHPRLFSSFLR